MEVVEPIWDDVRTVEAAFCAGVIDGGDGWTSVPGALVADRLGLLGIPVVGGECSDVSSATGIHAAWHYIQSGRCASALVLGVSKTSDATEDGRRHLLNRVLDHEITAIDGLDFTGHAGLLASLYLSVHPSQRGALAAVAQGNRGAWAKSSGGSGPPVGDSQPGLVMAQPLVRGDIAELVDGAAAIVLRATGDTSQPGALIEAVSSASDAVHVWDRQDPLELMAAYRALQGLRGLEVSAFGCLEVDASCNIVEMLTHEAVHRVLGELSGDRRTLPPMVNARGGPYGRGRVFGVSGIYALVDMCGSLLPLGRGIILSVSGLGSQAFGAVLSSSGGVR